MTRGYRLQAALSLMAALLVGGLVAPGCGGQSEGPGNGGAGGQGGSGGSGGSGGASLCELPAESGNCNAYFPRWWFNAETHACEPFVYGGCGGNANNFETAEACVSSCAAASVSDPCEAIRCLAGDICVYFSDRAGCGTPCTEGKGCADGLDCACGSSCPGCDDCGLVCRTI